MTLYRTAGASAADNIWSGVFSNKLAYRETYIITDSSSGDPMELDEFVIEIQFREYPDASAVLILSTEDGTLILEDVEDENGISRPTFRPDDVDVSALSGEYIGDIIYQDSDDVTHHLAHGVVTFRDDPAQAI